MIRATTRFQGKGEHAYRELKRRIMVHELAPGQLLQEPELMDELGLGRTPIREAIQRLAAEKLVVARPRQTAFVAPILAHELAEIVEMRLMLEVSAARMAAERGTAPERTRLRAANAAFHERVQEADLQGVLSADAEIHGLVASMSRNSLLSEYSERLASLSHRVWWLSIQSALREKGFIGCHDDLVRAICAGDAGMAARAAEEHLILFQARLGRLVQAVPPGLAQESVEAGHRVPPLPDAAA